MGATTRRKIDRTSTYTGGKPLLHVSDEKKAASNFAHTQDVMDFYISNTYFKDLGNTNHRDLYILYDAYNNIIPEHYFHYITNPLNTTRKEHKNFPAKIRPYSILRPNIDLLLGEFDKRPNNYTVVTSDSATMDQLEQQLYQITLENLQANFINEMSTLQGIDVDPNEKPETPEQVKEKYLSTYRDERAIWAQVSLEELDNELRVDEVFARIFKDYVIAGEGYSYKDIEHDRAVYERVSPIDIDYDKSPDVEYVEDASWVVQRRYMTAADIVGEYYDELGPKDITNLESQSTFTSAFTSNMYSNRRRKDEDLERLKLAVFRVAWKYYKKIGFLTYIDEYGEQQEMVVDETYKPDASRGESVEWSWVTEWWKGVRVDVPRGNNNENAREVENDNKHQYLYLRMQKVKNQRNVYNDFAYCKGPFNGIRFSDAHTQNTSITELGMPYQILYIILHYRLELAIAKTKGNIGIFDINSIPKKQGWDEEKWLYWAEANGYAFVDRNQLGVDKSFNQYTTLQMGQYQHIENLTKIMEFIRAEWDQLVGITPQRKGQISASETASGIDAARYQSSVISERLFSKFDEFMLREREGLLDLSKFLNKTGRRMVHYGSDMRTQMLDIDGDIYKETEYNIHITNSGEELENLNIMKQQAAAFASQGARPSIVAEVVQARNISKLKSILKKMEDEEMQKAEQMSQSEQAAEQQRIKIEQQYNEIKFEYDKLLKELEYDRKEDIEHIKGQYKLAENDFFPESANTDLSPADIDKSLMERDKLRSQENIEREKLRLENKKIDQDRELNRKKIEIEKYKADTQLKVAKENKNRHDTNSTKK